MLPCMGQAHSQCPRSNWSTPLHGEMRGLALSKRQKLHAVPMEPGILAFHRPKLGTVLCTRVDRPAFLHV